MKNLIACVVIFATFTAAANAQTAPGAAPTYLTCEFPGNDGTAWPVNISADERAAKVTIFMPATGYSETVTGAFTSDMVLFRTGNMSYSLSRVDLKISRSVPILNSVDAGTCKVQPAPRRAF